MRKKMLCMIAVMAALMTACSSTSRATCVTPSAGMLTLATTVSQEVLQQEAIVLSVPLLCQYPELPTGCEATAATMVLQYYGEDVSAGVFAREWLFCCNDFYWQGGRLYGPDPREVFVGDPFSENSYGCFAMPIVNAVNGNSVRCVAHVIEGECLQTLCETYVATGVPLLIWATMEMREASAGDRWLLPDGEQFTWIAGEHCLVLVGYDDTQYYFNDPRTGTTVVYERRVAQRRFEELGSQAVVITRI